MSLNTTEVTRQQCSVSFGWQLTNDLTSLPVDLWGRGRDGEWALGVAGSGACRDNNNNNKKMGSDESHFNVSLIVRDKVTRQCPQTTTFEEKGEPKRIRTKVPPHTSLTPYR